jgi:hypothetical protein
MKSEKEIILENLDFWSLGSRDGIPFFYNKNGLNSEDGGLIKEIELENKEDFQEVKRAIIKNLKEHMKEANGIWREHEMKIAEFPLLAYRHLLDKVGGISYDLTCFTKEEQEEIRKFIPLLESENDFQSPQHKSDIDWIFVASIAIVGTLLLFLVIWVWKFFKN